MKKSVEYKRSIPVGKDLKYYTPCT